VTSAQRHIFAVAVGAGSLLPLVVLDFLGQVMWFESPDKPAWQVFRLLWFLSLVVPGVLVGLIARRSRLLWGAVAGALGCVIAAAVIWVVLVVNESANLDSWLGVSLVILLISSACAAFAWLTGAALDRWSPNKSLERTREG
jgi:hypothetical protein